MKPKPRHEALTAKQKQRIEVAFRGGLGPIAIARVTGYGRAVVTSYVKALGHQTSGRHKKYPAKPAPPLEVGDPVARRLDGELADHTGKLGVVERVNCRRVFVRWPDGSEGWHHRGEIFYVPDQDTIYEVAAKRLRQARRDEDRAIPEDIAPPVELPVWPGWDAPDSGLI